MRAGLFLAYWPWFTPQAQVEPAVLAVPCGSDRRGAVRALAGAG